MAETSNQKLLEGLYTLGYPMSMLQEFAGKTDLPQGTFKESLEISGVNAADWGKVSSLLEYRKGDSPTRTALYKMLDIMGASPTTIHNVQYAGDDPKKLLQVLNSELGPERAGALMIKATGGSPPAGTVWNPFRGEDPPKGVDTRWGQKLGVPAPAQPDVMQGQANTRVRGQDTGLPVGPTAAQAKTMATTPPPAPGTTPAPGTGGGGGGGDDKGGLPTAPLPTSDADIDTWIKGHFGSDAWFMDVPEIKEKLIGLAKQGVTDPAIATREVSQTAWYNNTSSTARMWHINEQSDPATARQSVAQQASTLQTMAGKMGLTIDPTRLSNLAETSMRYGWTTQQINSALAAEWHYDPKNKQQNVIVQGIKGKAKQYYVPLSDGTMETWAKGIMAGTFTEEQLDQYMKDTAKSMFPQLTAAIDAGHTVDDYVDPYRQTAASTLDLPPDAIDFDDPKWRQALEQKDPKTGQVSVMTLTEWKRKIKTDPTYGYDKTQQGVADGAAVANSLLKTFGAIG